jgi:hypothetical protein
MLAALTIFFLIMGILSSAVSQALRLVEIDKAEATHMRDTMMRLGWFRDTVSQAVISNGSSPIILAGSAQKFAGYTLGALDGANTGPGEFSWEISFDAARGESALQYVAPGSRPQSVFSWPGSNGRFRFLDEGGRWQEQWPPDTFGLRLNAAQPIPAMPEAIAFEYGAEPRIVVAALSNRLPAPPSLKELAQ